MAKPKTTTIGDLRERLEELLRLPDDTEITFGGGDLSLLRLKNRGYRVDNMTPSIVQFEFSELYEITLDPGSDG